MSKFDAEGALQIIETERITHSQWVPTMFIRMLKLPDDVRLRNDTSSMIMAIHAAAPCPADVKHQMIAWWGISSSNTTPAQRTMVSPASNS